MHSSRAVHTVIYLLLTAAATAMEVAAPPPGPSSPAPTAALVVLVCAAGLPHGALDALVAKTSGLVSTRREAVGFHLAYLAVAAAVVVCWINLPAVTFTAFLAASALHFSADWRGRCGFGERLAAGLMIVTAPALLHSGELAEIYGAILGDPGAVIAAAQREISLYAAAFLFVRAPRLFENSSSAFWEILAVSAGALFLSPLIFFILYFCFFHSPRQFSVLARSLRSDGAIHVGKTAAAYSLAALILSAGAAVAAGELPFADWPRPEAAMRWTFIALAAVATPHMALEAYATLIRRVGARRRARRSGGGPAREGTFGAGPG